MGWTCQASPSVSIGHSGLSRTRGADVHGEPSAPGQGRFGGTGHPSAVPSADTLVVTRNSSASAGGIT